jgi:Na+-transporting methylmalonyl-CoA/oxaloacetate decarboxylase gamma subunit
MNLAFSWQNVLDGNGLWVTVTGMAIVFLGLIIISAFIAILPRALAYVDSFKKKTKEVEEEPKKNKNIDEDILAAIGYIVWCEREEMESSDRQIITMQRGQSDSIWAQAGRMKTLSLSSRR